MRLVLKVLAWLRMSLGFVVLAIGGVFVAVGTLCMGNSMGLFKTALNASKQEDVDSLTPALFRGEWRNGEYFLSVNAIRRSGLNEFPDQITFPGYKPEKLIFWEFYQAGLYGVYVREV